MCVQARCISDWLTLIDPFTAWQWIGPHGSGRSGVEMINTVIYRENTLRIQTGGIIRNSTKSINKSPGLDHLRD
jgi:hypothetical protein